MRTELISIATDTTPLDGAFYEPEGGAIAGAVMLFHGNTMNFYVGREDAVAAIVSSWLGRTLGET